MNEMQGVLFLFGCIMVFFFIGYLWAKWKEYKIKNTNKDYNMARRIKK